MEKLVEIVSENSVEVYRRLRAPKELGPEAREEFSRVVSHTPAELLPPGSLAALVQYCRHVVMARKIAERLEEAIAVGNGEHIEILAKAQARETKAIGYLMSALRLTPQSLGPGMRAAAKRAVVIQNPWDTKQPAQGG